MEGRGMEVIREWQLGEGRSREVQKREEVKENIKVKEGMNGGDKLR